MEIQYSTNDETLEPLPSWVWMPKGCSCGIFRVGTTLLLRSPLVSSLQWM